MDFEEIYKNYFKDVYVFILAMSKNPHTAEDITQDTFIKALKNIHKFRGDCSIKSWLCQIGKNLYLSSLKKKSPVPASLTEETIDFCDAETLYLQKEGVLSIYEVIENLDMPYREVIVLRIISDLSFREIADIFKQKEVWARVTFHRAKLKLRENLSYNKQRS